MYYRLRVQYTVVNALVRYHISIRKAESNLVFRKVQLFDSARERVAACGRLADTLLDVCPGKLLGEQRVHRVDSLVHLRE